MRAVRFVLIVHVCVCVCLEAILRNDGSFRVCACESVRGRVKNERLVV